MGGAGLLSPSHLKESSDSLHRTRLFAQIMFCLNTVSETFCLLLPINLQAVIGICFSNRAKETNVLTFT